MKKRKTFLLYSFIAIIVFLCIIGMKGHNHDFDFHLGRIEYIAKEFSQKKLEAIPIRIYSAQNNGYGYGTPLFYGEIFLYPFALMVSLGVGLLPMTMLAYFCFYLLNFFIPYFCCKKYFDEDRSATFALLYSISPYLIVNTLQRGAMGEILASAFMPLVLLIYFKMLSNEKCTLKQTLWLALSLSLILNAHNISALILVIVMAVIFVLACAKERKWEYFKNKFASFAFSAFIFLILNISFILPLLEQVFTYNFRAFSGSGYLVSEQVVNIPIMIVSFVDLFMSVITAIEPTVDKGIFYIPSFFISIFLVYYCFKNVKYFLRYKFLILSLITLNILICFSLPWNIFSQLLGFIQFPWRLTTLVHLIISIILTDMIFDFNQSDKPVNISICFLSVISFLYLAFAVSYDLQVCSKVQPELNNIMHKMCLQDYIGADSNYLFEETLQDEVLGYEGNYEVIRKNGITTIHFDNYDYSKAKSFELPIIPYKGYEVLINESELLDYEIGPNSQMLVKIKEGIGIEKISIQYKGTIIQKVSFIVSVVSWLFVIVEILYIKLKKLK